MRRLIPVLALVMLAAACSGAGDGELARTGDVVITESDLAALFDDDDVLEIGETTRTALFSLIAGEVLVQGMETDFGLGPDPIEVESFYLELVAQMEAAGQEPAEFVGIPGGTDEMLRFNAELAVLRRSVVDLLILDSGLVEEILANTALITSVCVSHVLVETEEGALAVIDRLDAGEDLSAVAAEVSIDVNTPGGDLGCGPAARYVEAFAAASLEAPLGEVVGPVETEFGFHVLVVSDRSALSRADIEREPSAFVSDADAGGLWSDWFGSKLQEADVTVDERFGTWSPVGIVPSEG